MNFVTKALNDKLELWLSEHFCPRIESAGTIVWDADYKRKNDKTKYRIAIAFTRYLHSEDPVEYIIDGAGVVLVVPSFWLDIPKELVVPYLISYLDKLLSDLFGGDNGLGGNNTGNNGTKPCPPIMPPHQCPLPGHSKPETTPIVDQGHCDHNNQLTGYFINPDVSPGQQQ